MGKRFEGQPVQCPECGKRLKSAGGLGAHRRYAHGVTRGAACPRRQAKKRQPEASIPAVFDGVIGLFQANATLVDQCIEGLDRLLGEAKSLRKHYIRNADRLRKLQVGLDAFGAGK